MSSKAKGYYPFRKIWNYEGINIQIGGLSFEGAIQLQEVVERNDGDLLDSLSILTECQKSVNRQLAQQWKCDDDKATYIITMWNGWKRSIGSGKQDEASWYEHVLTEACNTPTLENVLAELKSRV